MISRVLVHQILRVAPSPPPGSPVFYNVRPRYSSQDEVDKGTTEVEREVDEEVRVCECEW